MAQNNQPDFNQIAQALTTSGIALTTLSTQVPLLSNLAPIQLFNQILANLIAIEGRLGGIEGRLGGIENSITDLSIESEDLFIKIEDIEGRLGGLEEGQQRIEAEVRAAHIRVDNTKIKSRNTHRLAVDISERLEALLDLHTGRVIPRCPRQSADIDKLTAPQTTRILQALRVTPPGTLQEKRKAVHAEFH